MRRIFQVLLIGALVLYFGAAATIVLLRYVFLPDIGLLRPAHRDRALERAACDGAHRQDLGTLDPACNLASTSSN
ncbi:MAG: hypothetical protein WDN30_06495 [Pararobbsia sp.]